MRQAVICHAPADAGSARELGGYIEANCPFAIAYEQAEDLVAAVERGLSDVTLVLLSPDAVPRHWKRARWEPVFIDQPKDLGVGIAFVLIRECTFPELLRRKLFFDLSAAGPEGRRGLKRWLLGRERVIELPPELPPEQAGEGSEADTLEDLRALADWPGKRAGLSGEVALAFAHASKLDFEGVFWIDCVQRSRAGVLGDAAGLLGLRLPGPVDENEASLREFCRKRRCLFVFEGAHDQDRAAFEFGGKASVLFASPRRLRSSRSLDELTALFGAWTQNPEECMRALGEADRHLEALLSNPASWPNALQLSRSVIALLKHSDRLAEAYETLHRMARAAHAREDNVTLRHMTWEQSWILEHWDEPATLPIPPPLAREPRQLTLEFAAG